MTSDAAWTIGFDSYDPEVERQRETIFALGNGVFVLRGAAPWSSAGAAHYPGTYLAAGYARFPAEIAGETVQVTSLANLPNPLPLSFRIGTGAWFDLDAAEITEYRHELDLRGGVVRRDVTCLWEGRRLRLELRHLVSMARPGISALRVRIVPLGWSGRVEVRAAIDGTVENRNVARYAPYPARHLAAPEAAVEDGMAQVRARLRGGDVQVTVAQRLDPVAGWAAEDGGAGGESAVAEQRLACEARSDVPIEICKRIEVTGSDHRLEALRAAPDFDTLEREHRHAWDRLWAGVSIEAEDPDLARRLRFFAFHLLQTVSPLSCALDSGIPARGWHGEGYRGHVFWDELFVFPFLLARFPGIAAAKLLYRHRRLDAARGAARRNGYRGAMYPWRSAGNGREVTPRWQWNMLSGRWMRDDTDHARHIGSAVVYNVWQHYLATGDATFLAAHGAEIILEVARFWASRAERDPRDGRYDIRGVVGPDEFHTACPDAKAPGLDTNAYTNVMAVWTLCRGLDVLDHVPLKAAAALRERLDVTKDETALWDRISRRMRLAFHEGGILSQFAGFERLKPLRPDTLPPDLEDARLDWALEATAQSSNAFQMTKQADTLTLFYLLPSDEVFAIMARLGYAFDRSALERTCRYYFERTTHRSSLSRLVYAGALAEVDPDGSLELFWDALDTDLCDLKSGSVAEGVHLGAMGGTLDVLQRRYLGLAPTVDGVRFAPSLPRGLGPLRLGLEFHGQRLRVESRDGRVRLTSRASNARALRIVRPGGTTLLAPGESLEAGNGG